MFLRAPKEGTFWPVTTGDKVWHYWGPGGAAPQTPSQALAEARTGKQSWCKASFQSKATTVPLSLKLTALTIPSHSFFHISMLPRARCLGKCKLQVTDGKIGVNRGFMVGVGTWESWLLVGASPLDRDSMVGTGTWGFWLLVRAFS